MIITTGSHTFLICPTVVIINVCVLLSFAFFLIQAKNFGIWHFKHGANLENLKSEFCYFLRTCPSHRVHVSTKDTTMRKFLGLKTFLILILFFLLHMNDSR